MLIWTEALSHCPFIWYNRNGSDCGCFLLPKLHDQYPYWAILKQYLYTKGKIMWRMGFGKQYLDTTRVLFIKLPF